MFKVADLCGGVGISGMGWLRAGCRATGFDVNPKCAKYYPGPFECVDIKKLTAADLKDYDVVALAAPCQPWSDMCDCRPGLAETYEDLITPMRPVLDELEREHGVLTVIENVVPCNVLRPERTITLCGQMFGKQLYRHRKIETGGFTVPPLIHPPHMVPASRAGHWVEGTVMSIAGHVAPIALARELMGVPGSKIPREFLVEAAPAMYMAYVAAHAQAALSAQRAA